MGNACRRCVDCFVEPDLDPAGEYRPQHGRTADQEARPVRPGHGIPVRVTGFAALARDVLQFETTGQLPDGLSRGVDAPEIDQPYGPEAKEVLLKLVEGESLKLLVYKKIDHYKRIVADIYCNNMFIQEVLLKQGCVWHFKKYDKRPEFARWEKEARAARVGLWAKPNPKEPWDYREEHREKYQRNWH